MNLAFMLRLPGIRILLALPVMLAVLAPVRAAAQDDSNGAPLGDVARTLRKKTPSTQPVIDDDNLPQVMEQVQQADSRRGAASALRFLMAGEGKGFRLSTPDVTCSLSFTPNVKSLLSSQYSEMDLPQQQVTNLQGQATIEGDTLTLPIFNGTDWHVSELDVALTVIHKRGPRDPLGLEEPLAGNGEVSGAASDPLQQVRPEKKPDVTLIYRMRAAAPPWERSLFNAPLDVDLAVGDEWHWAIVQAKGYPPESYTRGTQQPTPKANASTTPMLLPAVPETPTAASLAPTPQ
jgi:hypothetical protein